MTGGGRRRTRTVSVEMLKSQGYVAMARRSSQSTSRNLFDSTMPLEYSARETSKPTESARDNGTNTSEHVQAASSGFGDQEQFDPNLPQGFLYVESIRGHRVGDDNSERQFLIQWCEYPDRAEWTWEPESNLDGCFEKLSDYCCSNGLTEPRPEMAIAGHSKVSRITYNPANWVNSRQILDQVKRLAKQPMYEASYSVYDQRVGFNGMDCVYLDIFWSHAFVYTYHSETNLCRVADGANLFIEQPEYRRAIESRLNVGTVGIYYESQYKVDHCGSSAAIIMLLCMRYLKSKAWPEVLTASISLRKDITSRLHKQTSFSMPNRRLYSIGQRERPRCPHCERGWVKLRKCDLQKHIASCRLRSGN